MIVDGVEFKEENGFLVNDGGIRVKLAEGTDAKNDALNFLLDKPVSERFLYEKNGFDFIQKLIANDDCATCDEKTGEVTINETIDKADEGHINLKLSDGEKIPTDEFGRPLYTKGEDGNPLKIEYPKNDNLIPSPTDNLPADTKNEFAFLGLIAIAFLAFLGFNVK